MWLGARMWIMLVKYHLVLVKTQKVKFENGTMLLDTINQQQIKQSRLHYQWKNSKSMYPLISPNNEEVISLLIPPRSSSALNRACAILRELDLSQVESVVKDYLNGGNLEDIYQRIKIVSEVIRRVASNSDNAVAIALIVFDYADATTIRYPLQALRSRYGHRAVSDALHKTGEQTRANSIYWLGH